MLVATGWAGAPEILDYPLVPGSGREVPAWVLAGPVLKRLDELLRSLRRGYRVQDAVLKQPRGHIMWSSYTTHSLGRGRWTDLPCRFPDLDTDPILRRMVRWALQRVRDDLAVVGGVDSVARLLVAIADELLSTVRDVQPLAPSRSELGRLTSGDSILDASLRRGLEALGWIVDERGLGGGRSHRRTGSGCRSAARGSAPPRVRRSFRSDSSTGYRIAWRWAS